jgi:hypothetical protein
VARSSPANEVNDLEDVTVDEQGVAMLSARNDFSIALNRDGALRQLQMNE